MYLLILKDISFLITQSRALFKMFLREDFIGANKTRLSPNRPLQYYFSLNNHIITLEFIKYIIDKYIK